MLKRRFLDILTTSSALAAIEWVHARFSGMPVTLTTALVIAVYGLYHYHDGYEYGSAQSDD